MATLTATQLERLRRDLADYTNSFTDPVLQDNWDRMTAATTDELRHRATLALCFWQLLVGAVKLHDYQAGAVSEKLDQVFAHLQRMYDSLKPDLETATGRKRQVVTSGLRKTPHQTRRIPE